MERSAFFNSVAGDRKYKAEIFAGYFSKFITNGIFPLPADNLRIAAYDRMEIKAHRGTGYINGYLYENTDTLILKAVSYTHLDVYKRQGLGVSRKI